MNVFEIKKGCFKVYDGKTAYTYHVDGNQDYSKLHDPDAWYWYAQRQGMSESDTIDLMLKMLHVRRIVKVRWLRKLSLCVALIGARGSGKSAGACQIAVIDGLLAGRRVVSNMPIAVKVRYRDCEKVFETEDLDAVSMLDVNEFDDNYQDCMIVVDETNLALADSQRSTSNQALFFSYILQQLRKRKLDFIFTCQSESFQTNRARFQTDIYIACRDLAMTVKDGEAFINPHENDIGRKSEWKLYDMSGLIMGEVLKADDRRTDRVQWYDKKIVWNTPFWNCYSTELLQRREKYRLNDAKTAQNPDYDSTKLDELAARYIKPVNMVFDAIDTGFQRMKRSDVWEMFHVTGNKGMQSKLGKLLSSMGCKSVHSNEGYDYIFPDKDTIKWNLAKLGLQYKERGI